MITISTLIASLGQRKILKGVDLQVEPGSVHALMGPNGSGKSTLAQVLMGHPDYTVTQGSITFKDIDITAYSADKRAQMGIFLAFQHPVSLPGVSALHLLREVWRMRNPADFSLEHFQERVAKACSLVGIDTTLMQRPLNDGFSGGEKKRLEMVQLLVLAPDFAIIDEIDSGLDVDGLRMIAASLAYARACNPSLSVIIITHYQRILHYVQPDHVHIMQDGIIVNRGGPELAIHIERSGYTDMRTPV
jgi:Fe-S cluster assembly ATP-binding protein